MYVEGIVDKYPKELLEGRPIVEGNVIATLFKNVDYYDEWKLTLEDFVTIDGRLFYRIGQQMLEGGYKVLDIISLNTSLDSNSSLNLGLSAKYVFRDIISKTL
jgi:hypothetical protein